MARTLASVEKAVFVNKAAVATDNEDKFDALRELLIKHRVSAEVVEREESLLSSPLVSNDGYLAGYLLVKCFSTWAAMITPAFNDTDFALCYAIHHFFDDYGLVERLLAPAAPDYQDVAELAVYTANRLRSLFSPDDVPNRVGRFEAQMLADSYSPEAIASMPVVFVPPALDNDADTVMRAQQALGAAIAALSPPARANLARRPLLHLSSIPVTIYLGTAQRNGERTFSAFYGHEPLVAGTSRVALGDGDKIQGSIDIFCHAALSLLAITVSVRGEVIWHTSAASEDTAEEELFNTWLEPLVVERRRVLDEAAAATTEIEGALSADWASRRTAALTSLLSLRDETYADLGLPWLRESRRADFVTGARRRGFRGVVDPALIRSLAVLSLLDASGVYLEEASFSEASGSLEADCEALRSTFKRDFGGTPLALEPVRDKEKDRSRIHSFL